MRTLTSAQEAAVAAGDRASWVKVRVNDGATWYDLDDHLGLNWVIGVDYGETVNGRYADAVVTVHTRDRDISVSPLATSSIVNIPNVLLAVANLVNIEAAVMPLDAKPDSSDYIEVFKGDIDKVEIGADKTVIRCRGYGGDIADRFAETTKRYGTEAGRNVEDVIQDILSDWGLGATLYSINGTGGTPFQPGDSPGWLILSYEQQRQPVLDAVRILAQQIGYECRYIWNSNTSNFQLTLFDPNRAKSTPDRTFAPERYVTIGNVTVDRSMVRNYIVVTYTDTAGNRQDTFKSDASSISKYGRLWMEIAEEAGNQIDSLAEADAFAQVALDSLKDPTAAHRATVQFFPWVELGDLIRWEANGTQIDSDLDVAVDEIRHRIDGQRAETTLMCRGVPYAAMERWRGMQAAYSRRTRSSRTWRHDSIGASGPYNGDFADWGES